MTPEQVTKDPWETGTGMADDFDGWISEPYFGVDERYAGGAATLFCATLIDETGEPVTTIKYSVGEDWEPDGSGAEITHPTKAQINQNARFGRFIDRLVKPKTERAPKIRTVTSPAGKENGLDLGSVLRSNGGGTPLKANTFEGLGFHWNLHKMETMGKDEKGDVIYKDTLLPVEYKGLWKGQGAKAATAPAATTTAKAAPAAAPAASNGEIPISLRKKLTLAALENPDIKAFLKIAGRDREVLALPDELMGHILDASGEGFHAQAQG